MYNAEHEEDSPESNLAKIKLQDSLNMRKKKPRKRETRKQKKRKSYRSRRNRKSKTHGPSKFFKIPGSSNKVKIHTPHKKSKTPEPRNMKPLLKILETIRESP